MESNIKHISYQSEAITVLNYVVYSLAMYTFVSGRASLPHLAPPLEANTVLFWHKISLFCKISVFQAYHWLDHCFEVFEVADLQIVLEWDPTYCSQLKQPHTNSFQAKLRLTLPIFLLIHEINFSYQIYRIEEWVNRLQQALRRHRISSLSSLCSHWAGSEGVYWH